MTLPLSDLTREDSLQPGGSGASQDPGGKDPALCRFLCLIGKLALLVDRSCDNIPSRPLFVLSGRTPSGFCCARALRKPCPV